MPSFQIIQKMPIGKQGLLYLCFKSESALFLLHTSANSNPVTFFSEAAEPHHHTALADGNSTFFYRQ